MDPLGRHNVTVSGSGDRFMMLAHGFGCDRNMWRFVAPAFEERHRVVLFDHVGFGTGHTQNAIVHDFRLDEGVALMGKPFTYDQLGAKVRAELDGLGVAGRS